VKEMDEKKQEELEENIKKSKQKSLDGLKENMELHQKTLETLEKKRALLQKIFERSLPGIKINTPEREFQKDEKYWELAKEWETLEHEHKLLGYDADIKRVKKILEETREQYKIMGGE